MSHPSPVAVPRSASHRRAVVLFWLGVLIAAVAVFWSLRGVAWVDLHKALLGAKWQWLLVAWGLMGCSMGMRAFRWATLFPPSLGLGGRTVFAPMMVGYLFNLLLPGRMGELGETNAKAGERHLGDHRCGAFGGCVADGVVCGGVVGDFSA